MRMFPSELPASVSREPRLAGEARVYRLLKEQFDGTWIGFYSRPWLGTNPDGSERDGESDFVVAHPDEGMLVIEVKGGQIDVDRDGQWRSTDRHGFQFRIKNPVTQAKNGKYELLGKLRDTGRLSGRFVVAAHGVILPDVSRPPRPVGPDAPPEVFACSGQLASLHTWALERLRSAPHGTGRQGVGQAGLGADGIEALERLLAPHIEMRLLLSDRIGENRQRFATLTAEQSQILDQLEKNNRLVVRGAAGTGKTVLAMHKARGLAESGKRVLFTCHTGGLARFLREVTEPHENIVIRTYEELVRAAAESSGTECILPADRGALASRFSDLLDELPDDRFDAIVVDEGQDFHPDWLESLEFALSDEDTSKYFIFYDSNQNVFSRSISFIKGLRFEEWPLDRNIRNTREIADLVACTYDGIPFIAVGPSGVPVEFRSVSGWQGAKKVLDHELRLLVSQERVEPDEIAVLVANQDDKTKLLDEFRPKYCKVKKTVAAGESGILIEDVAEFKGLECEVAIVFMVGRILDDLERLYVALSRPRTKLVVIGDEESVEFLKWKLDKREKINAAETDA